MDPVVIAHLSDLHFGEAEHDAVWNSLVDYINDTLKPHLVLVTGDIVNTPDDNLFRQARKELDRLRPQSRPEFRYRICPGNHDRFFRGNSAGRAGGFFKWLGAASTETPNPMRRLPGGLEKHFDGGLVLTPEMPLTIDLPNTTGTAGAGAANGNTWKLRVLGSDSCEDDIYFAQGVLNADSIAKLRTAALADTEVDLVVLLVHHHLLPIAALEQLQPNLGSLAQVTAMLNSGTALNMLAASYVNLVLHGHEHHHQTARFRTYDAQHGEVAVVSAGSATGTRTLKGWSIRDAQFNVLELRPDRSIMLKRVTGEKGYFKESDQAPIQLLDAEDIRRSRFLRKAAKSQDRDPPRSRLIRQFDFGLDRDGLITETKTDLLVADKLLVTTQNRSGAPSTATLQLYSGRSLESEMSQDFVRTDDGNNRYVAAFDMGPAARRQYDRVITSWGWHAGAVLTRGELDTLHDPGVFRKDGKEFVGVEAPKSDLAELHLLLRLPEEFAPALTAIEVWTAPADHPDDWRLGPALAQLVDALGGGLFSLRIPYPLPEWRYALAWPIHAGYGDAGELATRIAGQADKIHNAICDALVAPGLAPADTTVGLYVRAGGRNVLELLRSKGSVPNPLDLEEPSGMIRGAWWGRTRLLAPEKDEGSALVMQGDRYVAFVPLREPGAELYPAAGLLRVATKSPFVGVPDNDGAQVDMLRQTLAKVLNTWYE